jgi:hypothetical protein
MNTETEYLQRIAEEIAAHAKNNSEESAVPDHHLVNEAGRLEKIITHNLRAIENFTQRDTFHFNTLNKLVNICDLLYDTTGSVNPNVRVLLDLLTAVKQVIPDEIRPNLKLPKAFVELRRSQFSESWLHHSRLMAQHDVPDKLVAIAWIPFKRFTEPKGNLLWGDFTWLKGYQSKLDILDWENGDCNSPAEALLSLLIGRDFNDDRFFIYCKQYVKDRTKAVSGKRKRLLAYAECEKLVQEDTQVGMPSFDGRANSVSTRLIKWIREEIDFVETHERERPVSKFEFKWNIETIAFFFKLLWDHKVFSKVVLETFSEQIAANCSSIGKEEFQATSIYSRLYIKEAEVVQAVESLLVAMLADVRKYLQ